MGLSQKTCIPCHGGGQKIDKKQAQTFLGQLSEGWAITEDGNWLTKAYKFKNFVQALAFVNNVGKIAEEEGHHPDISFGWGYAKIKLQTHDVGGLHENDFIVAAKIDALNS